jgi:hypothetical protein
VPCDGRCSNPEAHGKAATVIGLTVGAHAGIVAAPAAPAPINPLSADMNTRLPPDPNIETNAFLRLIFMALFFALFGVARLLLWAVVLFQFLAHLLTGRVTQRGQVWGNVLSTWIYQMMLFMSYNTERMPFPFTAFGARED